MKGEERRGGVKGPKGRAEKRLDESKGEGKTVRREGGSV